MQFDDEKLILFITRILGINFIKTKNRCYNRSYFCYSITLILTLATVLSWSITWSFYTYSKENLSLALESLHSVCAMATIIASAVIDVFEQNGKIRRLRQSLVKYLKSINAQEDCKSEQRRYFIKVVIVNVVLIMLCGSRIFAMIYFSTWNFAKYYIIHSVIVYIVGMELMHINNSTVLLVFASKTINRRVENLQNPLKGSINDEVADIKAITNVYIVLCDLIESLNKAIGFRILLILLYTSIDFLHSVELLMNHWNQIIVKNISKTLKIVLSCVLMVICVMVVSNCQTITKEMQKTSIISCKRLLENSSTDVPKKNSKINLINESIYILSLQSAQNRPVFTAYGFFTIDYSMLYNMIATIIAYMVIVIQLTSTPSQ